jgi:photosystem II stability/assembly factor-like uncharacterized protein
MMIFSDRFYVARLFCLLAFCQLSFFTLHAQFRVKSLAPDAYGSITGISFVTPSTGFVSFQVSVAFTKDSGSTFTERPITYANTDLNGYGVNLTYGFSVQGVVAFSADSLLVYGDYGAESSILFSANQGQSWKMVYHRPITDINQYIGFTMSDMVFPGNGNIGIAVNDKDILRTTNRGQTWTLVSQLPDNITSRFTRLSFPEPSDGYAIAGDLLFKTSNGGAAWTQAGLPPGNTGLNFNNVSFVNPAIGYITKANDFTVYKTTNGAASWVKTNDETKFPIEGKDMHFINDSTGFIAARATLQVYKTTDNGVTWELCKRDVTYDDQFSGLKRMFFYNNDIA